MREHSSRLTHALRAALVVVLAGAVVTPPPVAQAAVASEATFTISGRGYGHGVGLSQEGAKGFALYAPADRRDWRSIVTYYYSLDTVTNGVKMGSFGTVANKTLYVNVDPDASYATGGNMGYSKSKWQIRSAHPGQKLMVIASGVTTLLDDATWEFSVKAGTTQLQALRVGTSQVAGPFSGTITVREQGAPTGQPYLTQVVQGIRANGTTGGTGIGNHAYTNYRSDLQLTASGTQLKLINRIALEDYVYGVVPREMPASWAWPSYGAAEAVKAQAVVARAYAHTSTRAELYCTTSDQAYGGHSRAADRSGTWTLHEDAEVNRCVIATRSDGKGLVPVWWDAAGGHWDVIRTYFFSTSGGHTENSENVWTSNLPYLRGKPDPYEWLTGASYHEWDTFTVTATQLKLALQAKQVATPDTITGFRVSKRGVSGRIIEAVVTGTGSITSATVSGATLRSALGGLDAASPSSLPDTWFYINPKTYRIAGADRSETSVQLSWRRFPNPQTASAVIIAGWYGEADALAASALAGSVPGGASLLLTQSGSLHPEVAAEIDRLNPTTVYIVGGTGVVSASVANAIDAISGVPTPKRLAGANRYGTAQAIASEVKRLKGTSLDRRVLIVNGDTIVDAVAAAPLAYYAGVPIVPVQAGRIPAESAASLASLAPAGSLVVGGSGVVSDAVVSRLTAPTRIAAGVTRYDTAAKLAEWSVANMGFNYRTVYVASGERVADALAASVLVGHNGNCFLFSAYDTLPSESRAFLYNRRYVVTKAMVIGGQGAVSDNAKSRIEEALE